MKKKLLKLTIATLVILLIIPLVTACTSNGSPAVVQITNQINNSKASVTTNQHQPDYISDVVYELDHSYTEQAPTTSYAIPNDEYFQNQWALSKIDILDFWAVTTVKADILVAVLDTGIDGNHEDLKGKVVAAANFTDSPTVDDIHGHGTHIAGIIAAVSNNGIGISGVAPESLLINGKVADDRGRVQVSALAEAIIWAVNNGASVINISIQISQPSQVLEDAINYAWNEGAVIITSAGNNGNEIPVYPAYYKNCIAVAAIKADDTLAPLSNYGDWVDVAAPGYNIYSTLPDNSYGNETGTSFATAYVSGLAALLFDVVTDTNGDGKLNDEVRIAIESGCLQIEVDKVGKGLINANNSLQNISYNMSWICNKNYLLSHISILLNITYQ